MIFPLLMPLRPMPSRLPVALLLALFLLPAWGQSAAESTGGPADRAEEPAKAKSAESVQAATGKKVEESPAADEKRVPDEPATEEEIPPEEPQLPLDPVQQSIGRLDEIQRQVRERQREIGALTRELTKAPTEERKREIDERLKELRQAADKLDDSFEKIAVGGIDFEALNAAVDEKFDWKEELLLVTRPLLGSLKELTEKPRKIEQLRAQIQRGQRQLEVADRALAEIKAFRENPQAKRIDERLKGLEKGWEQRKNEIQNSVDVARYQLDSLLEEDGPSWKSVSATLKGFMQGRGLTLAYAVGAALVIWSLGRWLLRLWHRRAHATLPHKKQRNRDRVALHVYRIFTFLLAVTGALLVFYSRSDLLLLALTLFTLFLLTIGLRNTAPRFISEIRILLDFGSVREGERILYNGLPMEVRSIQAFAILRNPELEGIVRLPLERLDEMISRPCGEEPWFPCRAGEFIRLEDGTVAEVLRQTLEQVQLRIRESLVQVTPATLLGQRVFNLSREGFAIPVIFGIDYRHQPIALDQVPKRLRAAVEQGLAHAGFMEFVREVLVDFKQPGVNSLDYHIYATLEGGAAASYSRIERVILRACVEAANREGWVIPYNQLTLHAGEGFDGARAGTLRTAQS